MKLFESGFFSSSNDARVKVRFGEKSISIREQFDLYVYSTKPAGYLAYDEFRLLESAIKYSAE